MENVNIAQKGPFSSRVSIRSIGSIDNLRFEPEHFNRVSILIHFLDKWFARLNSPMLSDVKRYIQIYGSEYDNSS